MLFPAGELVGEAFDGAREALRAGDDAQAQSEAVRSGGRVARHASRIEGLCSQLGAPWLVSNAVAEPIDAVLEDYGAHALEGIAEPVRVWGPPRNR